MKWVTKMWLLDSSFRIEFESDQLRSDVKDSPVWEWAGCGNLHILQKSVYNYYCLTTTVKQGQKIYNSRKDLVAKWARICTYRDPPLGARGTLSFLGLL